VRVGRGGGLGNVEVCVWGGVGGLGNVEVCVWGGAGGFGNAVIIHNAIIII